MVGKKGGSLAICFALAGANQGCGGGVGRDRGDWHSKRIPETGEGGLGGQWQFAFPPLFAFLLADPFPRGGGVRGLSFQEGSSGTLNRRFRHNHIGLYGRVRKLWFKVTRTFPEVL